MDFLAQTILPYILIYKYWALFALTFLSCLALPIPAGSLLTASSVFASQGYLNFFWVVIVAVVATVLGDNLSYWIVRLYGHKLLDKAAFTRNIIHSENFTMIEKSMQRRPGFVVFISRFEVIATLSVNVISGLSKVPYKKFLLYEVLGGISYIAFYATLGYVFGDSWEAINDLIGNFSILILIVLAAIVLFTWKKLLKKLKQGSIEPVQE
jgi:membrane protein DedA with SNARE-associated domain